MDGRLSWDVSLGYAFTDRLILSQNKGDSMNYLSKFDRYGWSPYHDIDSNIRWGDFPHSLHSIIILTYTHTVSLERISLCSNHHTVTLFLLDLHGNQPTSLDPSFDTSSSKSTSRTVLCFAKNQTDHHDDLFRTILLHVIEAPCLEPPHHQPLSPARPFQIYYHLLIWFNLILHWQRHKYPSSTSPKQINYRNGSNDENMTTIMML